MKKRSAATQATIDSINVILACDDVYITVVGDDRQVHVYELGDGRQVHVYESGNSKNAQLYKQGLCDALEILLHQTDSYKGYMFLNLSNGEVPLNETFNRKYF